MTDTEDNVIRNRRGHSVTRAEQITEKEKRVRKSQCDKPCHVPRDSLFSWSSEFSDFTGLVNWGFLMLFIGGIRLCLENLLKYGIRVDPFQWISVITGYNDDGNHYPTSALFIFSIVPAILCLLLEKGLALGRLQEGLGISLHICNILFLVTLPVVVIHNKGNQFSFVGATMMCFHYLILFLKLWSYIQTNMWCRTAQSNMFANSKYRRQSLSAPNWNQLVQGDDQSLEDERNSEADAQYEPVKYPDNLNIRDLCYFLLAPTLCYEHNFPRTERIRKRFLIKRILEVVVGVNLMLALFQQWMVPCITNSLIPFSQTEDYIRIIERLLKLSVPNHLMWLCFFYLIFHSFLNLMGELLHFADRTFYMDWWNANNIDTFWRTWNMPVHRWAVRHVYIPLTEMGYSRKAASGTVFFISAFFHEYLVSVPLQTFRVWAFLAMMGQLPLSALSRYAEKHLGPRWGNIIVWSSIILGQPLAIMMYYHDYAIAHYPGF